MDWDYLSSNLTGEAWEEKCHLCYRMRYQNEHYEEIPANYKGDAGIEGFTRTGIVIQCYCPEKEYTNNELYEHQRDKITHDINKLLDSKYKTRLVKMGVPIIHEWHFVTPFYKDNRILEHTNTKKLEVLKAKKDNPNQYDYIADDFDIVIKVLDDFKVEFSRLFRDSIIDEKLNLELSDNSVVDWSQCDSEKVSNIKRKVQAVMNDVEDEECLNELVEIYVESYISGIKQLNKLIKDYPDIYAEVFRLEQAYKKQVKISTMMNSNASSNKEILDSTIKDFQDKLKNTCGYFDNAVIIELSISMISMWLADCSLYFRK